MTPSGTVSLGVLIGAQREPLLARWRMQVRQLPSARALDTPTLNDHIPVLLGDLVAALESSSTETIAEAIGEASAPVHGMQRVEDGFDIAEVVAEYNILRGCIHDLAEEHGLTFWGQPFHIVNNILDGAIGLAVQTFATRQALEVRHRREEYLSFVAHDLRTPLNAISLAVRVLEIALGKDMSPEIAKMVRSSRRNVTHLELLVGKILEENANLETEIGIRIERREFDLWPLVEGLIHDLHPVGGTDSTKLINTVPDDLTVFADAGLLRRVFQNLIANAIRYTPRGTVTIDARSAGPGAPVECSIIDSGTGISRELLDKVFDKGEADPGVKGGTGLGLAIVKTFIEAHGGTVSVESVEGHGSAFKFTLPANLAKQH